jgi:hypothetical protein
MSLAGGDLTTPARFGTWLPNLNSASNAIVAQLITACSQAIYSKLSRARTYSQLFTRIFDGVGTNQIVLPDYPVTSISIVQIAGRVINPAPLPLYNQGVISEASPGYGYRFVPWSGELPGQPSVLEFNNGYFPQGAQNVKVTYTAGYLIQAEPVVVPVNPGPYAVTVMQPEGIWCLDNGVTYASGTSLVPVTGTPSTGQYVAPTDTNPGVYTFSSGDAGRPLFVSYSFIPADLEEACIQYVAERYSYRSRIGEMSKSLGGQETIHYMRGGRMNSPFPDLPPEVMGLIWPYVTVVPPAIGAPI